ncbi:hypothetical protein [Chroococcidiopsis sp.]|uniref:hypothetical protein n=1 Tax=Chroococcidiopsis sp. TaxID=3088168 RepID=UPI003F30F0A3
MTYRINAEILVRILRSLSVVSKWSYKLWVSHNEYRFIIEGDAACVTFQVQETQFSTQVLEPIGLRLPLEFVRSLASLSIKQASSDLEILTGSGMRILFLGDEVDVAIVEVAEASKRQSIEVFPLEDLIALCNQPVHPAEALIISPLGSLAFSQQCAEAVLDLELLASRYLEIPDPALLMAALSKLTIEASHLSELGLFGSVKLSAKSKLPSIAYSYGPLLRLDHRERRLDLYRPVTEVRERGRKLPLDATKMTRTIDRLKQSGESYASLTRTTRITYKEFVTLFGSITESTEAYLLDNLLLVSNGKYDRLHTVPVLQPVRKPAEPPENVS